MYRLITSGPLKVLLAEQLPILAGSFVIAEAFYKFHSFTLECLAFLSTWLLLDGIASRVQRLASRWKRP